MLFLCVILSKNVVLLYDLKCKVIVCLCICVCMI